jgi:hypothetical protein
MTTQQLAPKPTTEPVVGMGATEVFPQDHWPMRIVRVTDTGSAIWVVPVGTVNLSTGHSPARRCNGYPVWDHTYTDAELDTLTEATRTPMEATRRSDGRYRLVGQAAEIAVGAARYVRNYAD